MAFKIFSRAPVKIAPEILANSNVRYIVQPRVKGVIKAAPETCNNPLIGMVRTPRELISEQLGHTRITGQLSELKNASRIETTTIDIFSSLLKDGADESIFMIENPHKRLPLNDQLKVLKDAGFSPEQLYELKLINSRDQYKALTSGVRNGERKLIETDLAPVFSMSLAEIERDGSANLKVIARYFEFLKRVLEKNFIEKEMWAHFAEESLKTHEKLKGLDSLEIAEMFSLPTKYKIIPPSGILLGALIIGGLIFAAPAAAWQYNHWGYLMEIDRVLVAGGISATISLILTSMGWYGITDPSIPVPSKKIFKSVMKSAKEIENMAATERESERIQAKGLTVNTAEANALAAMEAKLSTEPIEPAPPKALDLSEETQIEGIAAENDSSEQLQS